MQTRGHCDSGDTCKWYWEFWKDGQPRSTSTKTPVQGPVSGSTPDVNLSTNVSGLAPNTTYRWVACGSPNNGGGYGCVGPNGQIGSATADPPPDFETFTTRPNSAEAMSWNGTSWSLQQTPSPPGASYNPLYDVSCTATTVCTAVGTRQTVNGGSTTSTILAERWNGTSWTIQTTPNTSGVLRAVSCTSANACTAVGSVGSNSNQLIILRWNGTSWAAQTPALPSGATRATLTGVSCASTTLCMAVGSYSTSSTGPQLFAEKWDGSSWTLESVPTTGTSSELTRVSCPAITWCTAVGAVNQAGGIVGTETLAVRWTGTSWSAQSTPLAGEGNGRDLDGVSCPDTLTCAATGTDFTGSTGYFAPLAEAWDSSSGWTVQSTQSAGTNFENLESVSCSAPGACTAVGDSFGDPLAERFGGTSWTIQTTPATRPLRGVSCVTATFCVAVGGDEAPSPS